MSAKSRRAFGAQPVMYVVLWPAELKCDTNVQLGRDVRGVFFWRGGEEISNQ
jgi:hypothetical protein